MFSSPILNAFIALLTALACYVIHVVWIAPIFDPLRRIPGPLVKGLFGRPNIHWVMDPNISPKNHDLLVKRFGPNIRIRGLGPWDERLLTLDPVALAHVLKKSTVYEKPWQSRRMITGLIGCGMLAAEGSMHKRQRRVSTPAFSIQNLRALVPLVMGKGMQLKDKWASMIEALAHPERDGGLVLDVASWISRATFDVIGIAGFEYEFNAIENETNELFVAYKDMFEVAISQNSGVRTVLDIYLPFLQVVWPTRATKFVAQCQKTIKRVAGKLIQEKKRKILEAEQNGTSYAGKDLLTLLLKSNAAADLPPDQRISDEDILHNVNTFMFAGSDTTSLALTWTFLLLAQNPAIQVALRSELLEIADATPPLSELSPEEAEAFFTALDARAYLNNVVKESLRLIPPVHSSIRVATEDDIIPTSHGVHMRDGSVRQFIHIKKGSFVHVAVEGFNLNRSVWGEDAWEFKPERWDDLPEAALSQPGLFANLLTFSAGPRSCIGVRFSLIEMKTFLFILLTNFVFHEAPNTKIVQANVVLTRPYVQGRFKEGSQCPLVIKPLIRES